MTARERVRRDEVRRAAATRPDIARVVLVERHVEPRTDEPFDEARVVVVLDEPPAESIGPERARDLIRLFAPAVVEHEGFGPTVPSAIGIDAAVRGGAVLYERAAT